MTAAAIRRGLRLLAQPVTYLGIAMLALIYGAVAMLIISDRSAAYHDAVRQGANLVHLFDQSYSHIFKSVNSTLLFLRRSYAQNSAAFKLSDWARDLGITNELSFNFIRLDADGRVVEFDLFNGHHRRRPQQARRFSCPCRVGAGSSLH